MNKRIAVLLTCFNRKEKTLQCLNSLESLLLPDNVELTTFLVDDGSKDGTSQAVREQHPSVRILCGDGSLFWAGGMRLAWQTARNEAAFNFYFLINDDTVLYPDSLSELLKADFFAHSAYGKSGVYVGSTIDPLSGDHSYGGEKLIRSGDYSARKIIPDGTYQICDFANANILLVSAAVVDKQGIFDTRYVHSIADYDYAMQANRNGFPVLLLPRYAGECVYDHTVPEEEPVVPLKQRIKRLFGVKGYAFREFLYFIRKFFPKQYLKTALTLWVRTLFPVMWRNFKKNRK